uniref:CCDC50_N domain-containing protein n=1 Tax=Mesocestoides corti TaxID=53468 RepID=A0A5K3FXN3_MESCO
MLSSRLSKMVFFRFQLGEELRYREALERDIRSQQSALRQFHIDKRIDERRKNQHFGENIVVNRSTDAPSNNERHGLYGFHVCRQIVAGVQARIVDFFQIFLFHNSLFCKP